MASLRQVVVVLESVVAVYAGLGVVFAVVCQVRGLARLDPAAAGAGWGFRLLITPGIIGLWPVLARRWRRGPGPIHPSAPARLRRAHAWLWKLLVVLGPVVVALAIVSRH